MRWFLLSVSVLVACAGTRAVPASEPKAQRGSQAFHARHALIEREGLPLAAVCAALRSSEPDPVVRFGRTLPLLRDGYLMHLAAAAERDGRALEQLMVARLGLRQVRYVDCAVDGFMLWIPGAVGDEAPKLDRSVQADGWTLRGTFLWGPVAAQDRRDALVMEPDFEHQTRLFCQYQEETQAGYAACLTWIAGETAKLREELMKPSPHELIEHEGLPVTAVCAALQAKHADPLQGFWHALPVLRHGSLLELEGCGPRARDAIDDLLPRLGSYQFKQVDCGAGARALWIFGRVEAADAFEAAVVETSCRVRSKQHFSPERGALHLRAVLAHDAALAPQLRVICQYSAQSAKYLKRCLEDVPAEIQTLRDDARVAD